MDNKPYSKSIILLCIFIIFLLSACNPQLTSTLTTPYPIKDTEGQFSIENIFFADPETINPGECSFLRWEITQGFSIRLGEQPVENAGEQEVCPAATTTYVLSFEDGKIFQELPVTITVGITSEDDLVENLPEEEIPPGQGQIIDLPNELPAVQPGRPAYEGVEWQTTGGPPGGLGYDIRMDPRDPDVMYVTDAQTGVFKSLDGGETWFPINDGITTRAGYSGTTIPVFSLSIDPNNPDIIWAGTQFSSGVFRTENGGDLWQAMNTGSNGIIERQISIRGFTVEPGNSDVIYFAGEISSWEWQGEPQNGVAMDLTKGVVYKSMDGGKNWRRSWYGDNLARYIWVNPENTNQVFVSTGIFDREAANSNPETSDPGGVGILRSQDGGETWETLDEDNGIRPDEYYFGSLYMHPENPDILIAAAGNDPYLMRLGDIGAIYLTENGGDQWHRVLELGNASIVEICESNPDVMYAGSIRGIYRSEDGGWTWTQTSGNLWGSDDVVAGFPIDMQCDPRDPMRVFVNNYIGGNFLSVDGGEHWEVKSKGYTGAMQRQVAVAYGDSSTVYTAGRMGVFKSIDGGENWLGTAHGPARVPEAIVIAVSPFDPNYILAVLQDGGPDPKLSTDGGKIWQNILTGLWKPGMFTENQTITKILFSKNNPGQVFATAGSYLCFTIRSECESSPGLGVIRSGDAGITWERTGLSEGQVTDLEIVNENLIYAAVYPSSIYRSGDGGATWELVAENISDIIPGTFIDLQFDLPYIISIGVDPFNHEIIFAGFERGGIMRSSDGGETWQHFSAGMAPETTIMDIEVDPHHQGTVYLASLTSGVFYKTGEDQQWTAFNEGLVIRTAIDLALSADGSVLYLATDGGGIYRLDAGE